jgi:hypothetical protein
LGDEARDAAMVSAIDAAPGRLFPRLRDKEGSAVVRNIEEGALRQLLARNRYEVRQRHLLTHYDTVVEWSRNLVSNWISAFDL